MFLSTISSQLAVSLRSYLALPFTPSWMALWQRWCHVAAAVWGSTQPGMRPGLHPAWVGRFTDCDPRNSLLEFIYASPKWP